MTVQHQNEMVSFLRQPLFLSMFGLVSISRDLDLEVWKQKVTRNQQWRYLFDQYWKAMMKRNLTEKKKQDQGVWSKTYGNKFLPSENELRHSLIFVATVLKHETKTEYLIEELQPSRLQHKKQRLLFRLIFGLIFGLIGGLIFGLIVGLIGGLIVGLMGGLIFGLIGGLIFGLIVGLIVGLIGAFDNIDPVEAIKFSMSREARREIQQSLKKGLIVGLMGGLIGGLIFGLIFGLMGGLIDGLRVDIENKVKPNQGILNSRNNVLLLMAYGIPFAVIVSLLITRIPPHLVPTGSLKSLLASSLTMIVLSIFFQGGGLALIQHISLRIVLAIYGYAPYRYDRLLNYAAERRILQRVGGRYRFIHKLLQDHFAAMDLD